MKNKMKDTEAKSEEWWEVAKEYFTKEMKKNLVQHKVDEKILRYKLEEFSNFHLWQSNKYRGIGLGWGKSSKAQCTRGGNVN